MAGAAFLIGRNATRSVVSASNMMIATIAAIRSGAGQLPMNFVATCALEGTTRAYAPHVM